MAQARSIAYTSGERLLGSAVEIFRALADLRRVYGHEDRDPPLPDNILQHLPFRIDVRIHGNEGLIRFSGQDGTVTYDAAWLLQEPLAQAS